MKHNFCTTDRASCHWLCHGEEGCEGEEGGREGGGEEGGEGGGEGGGG